MHVMCCDLVRVGHRVECVIVVVVVVVVVVTNVCMVETKAVLENSCSQAKRCGRAKQDRRRREQHDGIARPAMKPKPMEHNSNLLRTER